MNVEQLIELLSTYPKHLILEFLPAYEDDSELQLGEFIVERGKLVIQMEEK